MSDARALAQLDELLDLDAAAREAWMRRLSTDDPEMHSRLVRLWNAAVANDGSQALRAPVLAGVRSAAETPVLEPGQIIAGYRLIEELGRGGMAVVWRADRADGMVKRDVALKLPMFLASSPTGLARFGREKDALAALSHPHIAQLHDAGVAPNGQPFIALELVEGGPITAYCDSHRLDIPGRLRLFLDVLAAVEHAHRHLIVHRDLKPSNILVDAAGRVKLLDFGIAKLLDEAAPLTGDATLTEHGNVVLTPRYAAPEQVSGRPISTLSDVFVLGVLLHQLLTDKLPYAHIVGDSPSLADMVVALTRGESSRPSTAQLTDEAARARALSTAQRLRQTLRGDLDTIVKKALAPTPANRYGSAGHLAEDIRRWLAHEPIAARPASAWYSAKLVLRRHRNVSVVAGLGLLAVIAVGGVAWSNYRESREFEARGVAVQDFMRDLVNDAEPDENQPDAPVAFVDMIDSAVRRARTDYTQQPALQGELLSELGRMYWVLGKGEKALPLLREAVALLERHAPADDPGLNMARTHLASELLRVDSFDDARNLALRAYQECTRDDKPCGRARTNAADLLGQMESLAGRTESSLAYKRAAIRESTAAYGKEHAITVLAMGGLATEARNAGRLTEAATAAADAAAIASRIGMKRVDRHAVIRLSAILDNDLGRYESARATLEDLLARTTEPDERARLYRLLANAMTSQGESTLARSTIDSALRIPAEAMNRERLFALQARSQVLALLEDYPAALIDIDAVEKGLLAAGYPAGSFEVLRARRIRSDILLRAGRTADAMRELDLLVPHFVAAPELSRIEFGQVLDLEGRTLRLAGRPAEARALHEQARREFEKQLPANHPFLLRNTLYFKEAGDDRESFAIEARAYRQIWPAASLWQELIDVAVGDATCAGLGRESCVFVL